jgi:hypothetical protein
VAAWSKELSQHWVSARLEPKDGHSLQELFDLLSPHAREVRILNGRILSYEGEEAPLRLVEVENAALIHVLPYQGFSPRYL